MKYIIVLFILLSISHLAVAQTFDDFKHEDYQKMEIKPSFSDTSFGFLIWLQLDNNVWWARHVVRIEYRVQITEIYSNGWSSYDSTVKIVYYKYSDTAKNHIGEAYTWENKYAIWAEDRDEFDEYWLHPHSILQF